MLLPEILAYPRIVVRLASAHQVHAYQRDRERIGLGGELKGRSLTRPGSLLKSSIPLKTWHEWEDTKPGFNGEFVPRMEAVLEVCHRPCAPSVPVV